MLSRHGRMISWVETFIKPCAFGAPQAATGLDKHLHPGGRVDMSFMPHHATSSRKNFLTSGASYKSGPGKA